MRKGRRVEPDRHVEYRVLITPKYKEQENKLVTLIALRTVNEFTSFRYEIVVRSELSDRTLRLNIHGLRTPLLSLPGSGPATVMLEYDNLKGLYDVVISKLDREENIFSVFISEKKVSIKKSPERRFAEIVSNEKDW
jgi:hypothetical protein